MFKHRLPLPPPRQLPWPLKPLESAQTSLSYDEFGRMVMRIQHDTLKGLTPEMLVWWFSNIGGDMEVEGKRLNRYLVWHPYDHIRWELARPGPDGRASVGEKFRIVEERPAGDGVACYRIARVQTIDEALSAGAADIQSARRRLEKLIAKTLQRRDDPVPKDIPDADLVHAIAQHLDPLEKQALLECNGLLERCEALVELLEMRMMRSDGGTTRMH